MGMVGLSVFASNGVKKYFENPLPDERDSQRKPTFRLPTMEFNQAMIQNLHSS
jgi:hypothetical protein